MWGPCSYKNIPSRRRGPRVLDCYCGFHLFQRHFSTFGHVHPTIRLQRQAPKTHQNDTKTLSLAITGKRLVRSALARKLPKVVREKPREERAGHALRLVPREQYNIERPPTTKLSKSSTLLGRRSHTTAPNRPKPLVPSNPPGALWWGFRRFPTAHAACFRANQKSTFIFDPSGPPWKPWLAP